MYMLTTVDNPFDPFTQFDEWFQWDTSSGYHTCAVLARVVNTSNDLPESIQESLVDEAIKELVDLNPEGVYRMVSRTDNNIET